MTLIIGLAVHEDFGDDLPLDKKFRECYRWLTECISLKDDLLQELLTEGLITWQERLALSDMGLSESVIFYFS